MTEDQYADELFEKEIEKLEGHNDMDFIEESLEEISESDNN